MREATKSSLYRHEVTEAAVHGAAADAASAWPPASSRSRSPSLQPPPRGRARPPMRQADRAIDWAADDTATVLRKVHAADGSPGVLDEVLGLPVYLHGAHAEGGRWPQRHAPAP